MNNTMEQLRDFKGFCRQATDAQVIGIMEKEKEFADVDEFRAACYIIALAEHERRQEACG